MLQANKHIGSGLAPVKTTAEFNRNDYYRRNSIAKAHIGKAVKPSVSIIAEVLSIDSPITEDHMRLCESIVASATVFDLPVPNTPHVAPFALAVGPENTTDRAKMKPGCYELFVVGGVDSYVGQSIRLGNRVKDHAKGTDYTTGEFVSSQEPGTVMVRIYEAPKEGLYGLTLAEFLCVLEQYLFYLKAPTVNKSVVATPGILQSEDAILRQQEAKGTTTFAYRKTPEGLVLIHAFPSRSMIGPLFGYNRLWIKGLDRYGGEFRGSLLFSSILFPVPVKLMEVSELIALHDTLASEPNKLWVPVTVTNVHTGEVIRYPSIQAARDVIGGDKSVYRKNRTTLYKRTYDIKL